MNPFWFFYKDIIIIKREVEALLEEVVFLLHLRPVEVGVLANAPASPLPPVPLLSLLPATQNQRRCLFTQKAKLLQRGRWLAAS